MTTEAQRSLEQCRAQHALQQIKDIENDEYGHYVSYVSALPATIVMNGLGQALTTLLAKAGRKKKNSNKDPNYLLYRHVASWLAHHIPELKGDADKGDADAVIQLLMKNDQNVYLRAQAEAMAYLHWLKQFARAYLQDKEDASHE